jgi:ubiquinone/menaquinone biosynthesis C-methylase UbiE
MEETSKDYSNKKGANCFNDYRENYYSKHIQEYSIRKLFSSIKDKLGDNFTVIDLACGTGSYTRIIREYTKGKIIGIDYAKSMIDIASEVELKDNKGIEYYQADCFEYQSERVNYEQLM